MHVTLSPALIFDNFALDDAVCGFFRACFINERGVNLLVRHNLTFFQNMAKCDRGIVVSIITTVGYAFHRVMERCWNALERSLSVLCVSYFEAVTYGKSCI